MLCGSYVCGTYTFGVPDVVVAIRIGRGARTVVASFVRTLRGRRAGVGPGRAHLRCQDEDAQEPAREGHRCRGALRAPLVRLVRFTECGRSRRQVPRLHLALHRSKRPAMRVLRAPAAQAGLRPGSGRRVRRTAHNCARKEPGRSDTGQAATADPRPPFTGTSVASAQCVCALLSSCMQLGNPSRVSSSCALFFFLFANGGGTARTPSIVRARCLGDIRSGVHLVRPWRRTCGGGDGGALSAQQVRGWPVPGAAKKCQWKWGRQQGVHRRGCTRERASGRDDTQMHRAGCPCSQQDARGE